MTEIEQKKLEIGNRLFELWQLLPEPKKSYTKYYQTIDKAIEDWCLSDPRVRCKCSGYPLESDYCRYCGGYIGPD